MSIEAYVSADDTLAWTGPSRPFLFLFLTTFRFNFYVHTESFVASKLVQPLFP